MSRRGENIYKRKDGRWEGRYAKGRKANGQLHYGYVYGKTYTHTRQELLLKKINYAKEKNNIQLFSGTVTEWLHFWITEQRTLLRVSTFSSYQHKLQKYIIPLIGEEKLHMLNAEILEQAINKLQQQGLAARTIHVIFRIFHKALAQAIQQGRLFSNPCTEVTLPKIEKKAVRALTRTEQKTLEQVAQEDPYGLPTRIALHTGLRIGEVAALRWQDLDLDEQLLHVQQTYQRLPLVTNQKQTTLSLGKVKSAASQRVIPLSEQVVTWLKQWKEQTKPTTDYVFSTGNKPMEPRLLTHHFHRIRHKAGLPTVHFHQLRHTFATRCLEVHGDISSISALLGHSSAKMTLDIYTDTLFDQRKWTIQRMTEATS